ncbi:MAG TPA: YARHG domain-containing protein [Pyrinomonadaceae bacterium]|nr:YARHG domain-containing protein [Pyrinomonadaceae bacterium]
MNQCPICGRTFTSENKFCLEDGTPLTIAEAAPTQIYTDEIPTIVVPNIAPTQQYQNQPEFQPQPQYQIPPSAPQVEQTSGKFLYVVIGLLLGAVFVLGGVAVWQFSKKDERAETNTNIKNKETPKPTATTKSTATPKPSETPEISDSSTPGKYPEGSTRLLDENDLEGKSSWDLRIMRNEIFARHGRRFKKPELRNYFTSQSWYNPQFDEVSLTAIEKKNVEFLRSYE